MQGVTNVQSVHRIFLLLEILHQNPQGITLTRLEALAGLPKSTLHRLLGNLIELGYARQMTESGRYRATYKMFQMGSGLVARMDYVDIAKPHLERLAMASDATVHLVVRDGAEVVYIYKTETSGMKMSSRIGLKMPLYCTGVGKAILAEMGYGQAKEIFAQSDVQPRTPHSITGWGALESDLRRTRARGWAMDDEENEIGIRCVAVALAPAHGEEEMAFSVSGIKAAMDDARAAQIAGLCLKTKQDILQDAGV